MKILIWFPLNVKGGGARLFVNLVSALSRHRDIEKIKVVLSDDSKNSEYSDILKNIESVDIFYYTEYMKELFKKEKEFILRLDSEISELESYAASLKSQHTEIIKTINYLEHEIAEINQPIIPNRLLRILLNRRATREYMRAISGIKNRIKDELDRVDYLSKEINITSIKYQELKNKKDVKLDEINSKEEEIKKNPVDYYGKDCDVIYFFWLHFIDFQKTSKPSVCTFQDTIILDFPENVGGMNAKIYWENSRKWIQATTIVVTSSNYVKSNLIEYFGEQCKSVIVIPHRGSPVEYFSRDNISRELLSQLPADYIAYPANLSYHKNHYNLFVAYSRFKYKNKYPLVLFGIFTEHLLQIPPNYPEFSNWARLTALIKRLHLRLNEDIYALGYIKDEDIAPLIKHAKALVMPSLAEGGGSYPVEEALRLGVPVACSDIPVMREHLKGRTPKIGWFDPESTDSIAHALNDLIEHYEEYKSSTVRGINDETQTWDNIADEYVKVFKTAIDKFNRNTQ